MIGARLLCIQGTSFSFIGPIIATGMVGGLPLIFGSCMAAAPIEMIVSRTFKYLRNIITPLVSGIVVLLIGLSLIKVGIVSCGGGYAAMDNGTFATWETCLLQHWYFLASCFQPLREQIPAYEFHCTRTLPWLWFGICSGKSGYECVECGNADEF